jgi:hypothetical protein
MHDRPRARIRYDGRQSETAVQIARGVGRLLHDLKFSSIPELELPNGRRADVVGLSGDGTLIIVEIKSSAEDMRADKKWREYHLHCDRLYFAISGSTSDVKTPEDAGLIVADTYGAAIVREAETHRIASATRRALTLRFAQTAANRLRRIYDLG